MPIEMTDRLQEVITPKGETGRTDASKFKESNQPKAFKDAYDYLPKYVIPDGVNINTETNVEDMTGTVGLYKHDDPTTVHWYDADPNTLIHEVEHLRQSFVPKKARGIFGDETNVGSLNDYNYIKLFKKIKELPQVERELAGFGSNWSKTPNELFANITAYKVLNEKAGIEFTKTRLGKLLGVEKGTELSAYIHDKTLRGVDKMYEVPQEKSFLEKFQEVFKKRPQ